MIYQNSNTSTQSALDFLGGTDKAVEQFVIQLSPAYQRPKLSMLLDQIEGGTVKKMTNRQFTIFRQDNDYPNMTIASRISQGANLKLVATDSSFAAIAKGNAVYAASGAIGKVVDKDNGYIVVSFVSNPNGNTSFVSADFAANEEAIDGGDIGNIQDRQSKETIFSLPDPYLNIIGTINATAQITFEDVNTKTYITNIDGQSYYATQKEVQTLERLMQQWVKRQLSDTPASFNSNEPIGASLVNQAKSMGGTYVPLGATSAFSASTYKNIFREYISKGGFTSNEVIGWCGADYMANFQDTFEDLHIKFVGVNNTVGGQSVKGIDFREYAYAGLSIKLMHDPIMDNAKMWGTASNGHSKRSNSCVFMNTSPAKNENGGVSPFACSYYFGETADIVSTVVEGMIGSNGKYVSKGSNGKKAFTREFTYDKQEVFMNPRGILLHGTF